MNNSINELLDTVIKNDYCIGCGICASLKDSPFSMELDEDGKYKAILNSSNELSAENNTDVLSICPFSNSSMNESEIAKEVFNVEEKSKFNEYTGYYLKNYAGYVKEGAYREKGSSGGMGNWIATQLLKQGLVDGIIHVRASEDNSGTLFKYQISYNETELSKGAKSKYYPIELSEVIKLVEENEGRYALIGIPCFIKSVRLLAKRNLIIKERVKFYIGLVCGHLKSDMFAKSMGWQMGIFPDDLKKIDFRKKLVDKKANNYGVEVEGEKEGERVVFNSPTRELYTTNWGHGLFKYNACEFCDDVLAETADITVGDAWLPEYTKDSMGTNVIIVRNQKIQQILEQNKENIFLEEIGTDKVYESQASGLRHRREGLSYRLYMKDQKKEWRPNKRVMPSNNISSKRKRIYEKRILMSESSFEAFKIAKEKGDFNVFINSMNPIIKDYNKTSGQTFVGKSIRKVKRVIVRLVKN